MSNAIDLPTLGMATYSLGPGQTFEFNALTATTNYNVTVKKDAAGRASPFAECSLTLRTYLEGQPSDSVVQSAVAILSQPAGQLIYTGHGTGDLMINTLTGGWDVNWGPWPTVATCAVNGGLTTEVNWTVTFSKPTAPNAITKLAIMEYCYTADVAIDGEGYSQRDCKGFLKIPMTRLAPTDRELPDSADLYREQIVPPIPVGFTRMNQHFGTDYSKGTLNFSFSDLQMNPNYPAQGVLTCRASHSWQSEGRGTLLRWTSTLEAEYTVAPFVGANVVFGAFMDLLTQRIKLIESSPRGAGLVIAPGLPGAGTISKGNPATTTLVIPTRFNVSEPNIHGPGQQKVRCSASYYVSNLGLTAIINKGGLWVPVSSTDQAAGPPNTWQAWRTKTAIPLGPRGSASIIFTPGDDSLIDLNQAGLKPTVMGG